MAKRIVIVGAVALGPKVACRVRRLDPTAKITVLDRDSLISYGGCGIPYYVGGDINDLEDLYSTTAHVIRDKQFFADYKGVSIRTQMDVVSISRTEKKISVVDLNSGEQGEIAYDTLVLATGARPRKMSIPGGKLPRVVTVANLHQAEMIKDLMKRGRVGSAVVIGAGAVGVEIAEALTDLWGVETTLIEQAGRVLPMVVDEEMSAIVARHLSGNGVNLLLGGVVERIELDPETEQHVVFLEDRRIHCDLVVLATGVTPNSELAAEAGLSIGTSGGILVDRRLRTSDPSIYAGGDCAELTHLVSGEKTPMPLGSLANRQGRIIASNICGGSSQYLGTVGTFCMKVFEFGLSTAGLTRESARRAGYEPVCAMVSQADHAHFYPNSELVFMILIADRKSRRILGVQALGRNGHGVKARVDAIAVLLGQGVSVDEICSLETGYAPPFSSAMDVVNNAGNTMDNILAGLNEPITALDFLGRFTENSTRVLDVRGLSEATPGLNKYGRSWLHIPQPELRHRYDELEQDVHYSILCDTGPRAYEAQVLLTSLGKDNTSVIQGGYAMLREIAPTFV